MELTKERGRLSFATIFHDKCGETEVVRLE